MRIALSGRAKIGTSLIELCAGLLIAIPVFLLFLDCAILAIGIQTNDKTCRAAARFAASGAPDSANLRAQYVVEKANEEKPGMIVELRLVSVDKTISANDLKTIQSYGGTVAGTVTVTTAADIKPFFCHWLSPNQQYWTFQSQQSFPFTYVVPNSATIE